jgi:hypothetical protein
LAELRCPRGFYAVVLFAAARHVEAMISAREEVDAGSPSVAPVTA